MCYHDVSRYSFPFIEKNPTPMLLNRGHIVHMYTYVHFTLIDLIVCYLLCSLTKV